MSNAHKVAAVTAIEPLSRYAARRARACARTEAGTAERNANATSAAVNLGSSTDTVMEMRPSSLAPTSPCRALASRREAPGTKMTRVDYRGYIRRPSTNPDGSGES